MPPTTKLWHTMRWLAGIALVLVIITTNVRIAANSLPLYEALFERHSVTERTGMSADALSDVGRQIQEYFNSDTEPLYVRSVINGVEQSLFNNDEAAHMADVKVLFLRTYWLQESAAILLAFSAVTSLLLVRRNAYLIIGGWLRLGALLTICVLLVLGTLSLVAFEQLFTVFHYLGFPQGNWMFNPSSTYLVRVFPLGFWQDVTLFIGLLSLVESALFWIVGFGAHVLLKRS